MRAKHGVERLVLLREVTGWKPAGGPKRFPPVGGVAQSEIVTVATGASRQELAKLTQVTGPAHGVPGVGVCNGAASAVIAGGQPAVQPPQPIHRRRAVRVKKSQNFARGVLGAPVA